MFTDYYKGFFIHGKFGTKEVTVAFYRGGHEGSYTSMHAAKCAITRKKMWPGVDQTV